MIQEFEVIKVVDLHNNRGQYIFARQVEVGSHFEIKEGSLFGDISISKYLDMPRILDQNQQQRSDVFIFRPMEKFPSDHFKEGQLVKLVIPD
ncbi:MAG: hypothetical protein ACM3H8_04925 [Sphingobacteriales bacterium]